MKRQYYQHVLFVIFSLLLVACSTSSDDEQRDIYAKVGDKVLTKDNIKIDYPLYISAEDSLLILKLKVNDWVETQLLYQKASLNILDADGSIDKRVQEYKEEVYILKYEQMFMNQRLDTLLPKSIIKEFYESHKQEFILNQPAVKPLFIVFPKELDLSKAKNWFYSRRSDDIDKLKDYTYQFSPKFYFEDTWMEFKTLLQEIPIDNVDPGRLFSPNGVILHDSINSYYIRITEFVSKGKCAPQELVKDDIVKILLHKRRLSLVKEMRNKIYQDALNKKEFQIFIDTK